MTDDEALAFACKHVQVWNSHALDDIMALYAPSVELVSPLAATLAGNPVVRGRDAVRAYFEKGLQRYPDLRFELIETFRGAETITLLFRGAGGRLVAEVMFLDAERRIQRVLAHYRCDPQR